MFRGQAGSGKTILGFHILEAGIEDGETGLFINLEEDIDELKKNAASLGFDTDAIEFLDLSPTADVFTQNKSYDVFEASEVEKEPVSEEIVDAVTRVEPDRVVVDPLTQFRYLTAGDYDFRKQVVGFMRFLKQQNATVVFTVQDTENLPTDDIEFITDGTFILERSPHRRTIRVPKFRGSATQSGEHAYRVTADGINAFPALEPRTHSREFDAEQISAGVPGIDELLNGGIERGTVSIISGPTGVGKTTLGTQFMKEAAGRGERSVVYLFEENRHTFLTRSEMVNIPVEAMVEKGTLHLEEIDALEQSPQEFASRVKDDVEENETAIVMIDGIAGYHLTLQDQDRRTPRELHRLVRYLKRQGVSAILIDETPDVAGEFRATSENISYLADNIVFLRHLELQGELRKAIGVLKKRTSDFERTLREYEITSNGITVGEPLTRLRGVMTGRPEFVESGGGSAE